MGNIKLGNFEVPLGSILVFVGAVVALISLFLGYVNFDYTILEDVTYSGMEVVTGWDDNIELSFVHFAPIIVAIAALIGMIMVIITSMKIRFLPLNLNFANPYPIKQQINV